MAVAAPPLQDTYRPLSVLAVIALGFGVLSPVVFLVDAFWYCLLVPMPGMVLAFLARRQVLRSEGTIAGYLPATLAAILSVASGFGWMTKALVVQAIVDYESHRFLEAWLQKLRAGQIGSAFLDTQRPDQRRVNFEVEDQRYLRLHFPGRKEESFNAFDNFRYNQLVNLLYRYRDQAKLTYLGRQDHGMVAGDQRFVNHAYELTVPPGKYLAIVRVESDYETVTAGQRRGWYIRIRGQEGRRQVEQTPYGRGLNDALTSVENRVFKWVSLAAGGNREQFLAEVAPPGRRDAGTVYEALRGQAPPKEALSISVATPMLLIHDEAKGATGWRLRLACIFESGDIEAHGQVELETDDLSAGVDAWRLLDCKFDGQQKRQSSSTTQTISTGSPDLQPRPR